MKTTPAQRTPKRSAIRRHTPDEIATVILEACSEAKAQNPTVLDVTNLLGISDYFVIVDGRSDRQVQGITNKVLAALDRMGLAPESLEGYDQAHWVLLDCGDVVLHVFYEPIRSYYDIEGLWANAKKLDPEKLGRRKRTRLKAA